MREGIQEFAEVSIEAPGALKQTGQNRPRGCGGARVYFATVIYGVHRRSMSKRLLAFFPQKYAQGAFTPLFLAIEDSASGKHEWRYLLEERIHPTRYERDTCHYILKTNSKHTGSQNPPLRG